MKSYLYVMVLKYIFSPYCSHTSENPRFDANCCTPVPKNIQPYAENSKVPTSNATHAKHTVT